MFCVFLWKFSFWLIVFLFIFDVFGWDYLVVLKLLNGFVVVILVLIFDIFGGKSGSNIDVDNFK